MAWKRHLWSTDMALVTFLWLADLIIFNFNTYSPYMPNLGSLSRSHGLEEKKHLLSTDLALGTFLRLADLVIFDFISYSPYMPNLGSLSHPHGLEEAPVVH